MVGLSDVNEKQKEIEEELAKGGGGIITQDKIDTIKGVVKGGYKAQVANLKREIKRLEKN